MSSLHGPIDSTMGSALVGTIVSAMLLGVTYVQTFYYFINYPKDPWHLKCLVACTAILDTTHQGLISHAVYHQLITNFNNPPSLDYLIWSGSLEALLGGMTSFLVQCFYTVRVWRLSKNYLLTGVILLVVLANAACGIVWVILALQMKTYRQLWTITPITISINALTSSVDILIAASLIVLLRRARTGFKGSDTTINRLIMFVVNTGVLTSVMAIAILIAISASPTTLIYASFYFCICRFYANSFLTTLNARKHLTGRIEDVNHMLVSMPLSVLSPTTSSGGKGTQNISIRIDTQTTRDRDTETTDHFRQGEKRYEELVDALEGTDPRRRKSMQNLA